MGTGDRTTPSTFVQRGSMANGMRVNSEATLHVTSLPFSLSLSFYFSVSSSRLFLFLTLVLHCVLLLGSQSPRLFNAPLKLRLTFIRLVQSAFQRVDRVTLGEVVSWRVLSRNRAFNPLAFRWNNLRTRRVGDTCSVSLRVRAQWKLEFFLAGVYELRNFENWNLRSREFCGMQNVMRTLATKATRSKKVERREARNNFQVESDATLSNDSFH